MVATFVVVVSYDIVALLLVDASRYELAESRLVIVNGKEIKELNINFLNPSIQSKRRHRHFTRAENVDYIRR